MNVKEEREKRSLTQQEMADATGIPRDRIAKWEQGLGNPKIDDYKIIEKYFREIVPQESYTERRSKLKNSDKVVDDLPVFVGNTQAGTIEIYSDDPSQQEPIGHLSSKIFPGCNHAEKINGDSMYPLAVNQGLAIGKIIDKRGIVWGEKYIIHTIHGQAMLKYVHPSSESKENIMIVSHNKKIPSQDIPLNDITFCCRVYFIVNPS